MEVINTIGRRKTAIARIYLSEGKGNVTINKKDYKDYFSTKLQQGKVDQAFLLTDTLGQYDVNINVDGGGFTGQVEAIRLGISRALVKIDEDNKPLLKAEGLMTRDSRMVERKKPGQKKA
ncbi:MAG: 30S ribosomal protein S9, partial [Flavobacteriales bacterium]